MKFTPIYNRVLKFWPEEIDISDGHATGVNNETTPSNTPSGGNGYFFPSLSGAWDLSEEKVDPVKDAWGDLMVWTMFQIFHSEAKKLIDAGTKTLHPKDVPTLDIEKKYLENLHSKGWEGYLSEYKGI